MDTHKGQGCYDFVHGITFNFFGLKLYQLFHASYWGFLAKVLDNIKDFKLSDIRVISAKEFYKEYIEPREEE